MQTPDRLMAMNAAHAAFRRDLERLAKAADRFDLEDPVRHASVLAGWTTFKNQLHKHHEGEDRFIWPRLREGLASSAAALSVLDEMDAEHESLDPLLKAVDDAFGQVGLAAVADVVDELITCLTAHLNHEEAEALPLIDAGLTDAQWAAVMGDIRGAADLGFVAEYLPWLGDGASEEELATIDLIVPPPFKAAYAQEWKPAYAQVRRW